MFMFWQNKQGQLLLYILRLIVIHHIYCVHLYIFFPLHLPFFQWTNIHFYCNFLPPSFAFSCHLGFTPVTSYRWTISFSTANLVFIQYKLRYHLYQPTLCRDSCCSVFSVYVLFVDSWFFWLFVAMILSVTPLLKCLLSLFFFYYQPIFLINYKLLFSDSRLDMTLESSTKQKDQIKIFSKACDIIHIESYSNLPPMCFI